MIFNLKEYLPLNNVKCYLIINLILDFFDYKQNPTKILDKKTNYYILNFWASWCAPCIKEMRSLNKLKNKLPKVKILTMSQDEDIEDAKNFFSKNNYKNLEKYYDFEKKVSKNDRAH